MPGRVMAGNRETAGRDSAPRSDSSPGDLLMAFVKSGQQTDRTHNYKPSLLNHP